MPRADIVVLRSNGIDAIHLLLRRGARRGRTGRRRHVCRAQGWASAGALQTLQSHAVAELRQAHNRGVTLLTELPEA